MAFDLASAKPVKAVKAAKGGFDLSSAKPITDEEMATAASEMMAGDVPVAPAANEIPGQRLTNAQEFYKAARPYVAPIVEVGGALVGGIYGAGAGTLASPTILINPLTGAMMGSGLGYGIAKEGLEAADVAMGMKQPRQGMEQVTTPLANIAEGSAYELGGQALGKVVGAAYKPTVNYLSKVINPKAAVLANAAEGKSQAIINALRNYDDFVAGGMPTAGVAAAPAGSTKYASLQQEVAPFAATPYYARGEANVGARRGALAPIAQDAAALAAAKQTRAATTRPLYEAAEKGVADVTNVASNLDTVIANNPGNRALVRELKQIRNDLIDSTTGQLRTDAKQISSVIDGLKARLAKEDNKFIADQLKDVREMLVDAVPGYRIAQEKFAEASKPINVMQIGQYLEGKLTPAVLTPTAERAGVFSAAVKEAPTTLKRSTGQSRYSQLTDVLSPDQAKVVEGIRKDLAREAQFEAQAAAGGKAGKLIPAEELARSPAFFSKLATLANTIVGKLQGKIDKKIAIELAAEMLDPKLAAASLEKAMARQAAGERFANPFKGVRPTSAGGRVVQATPGALGLASKNALAPSDNRNNLGK
jgi:hypothetical protein